LTTRTSILDYYGTLNAAYLHAFGEAATEQLVQELALTGEENVLEIGFGTGATLVKIKSRFPAVALCGVEYSPAMLAKATSRLRFCGLADQVELGLTTVGNRINYSDNTFDRIYCESVLAIQEDDTIKELIAEIHRLLKPNGMAAFNETIWLPEIQSAEIELINNICKREFGIIQSTGRYKTEHDWLRMLEQQGFTILKHEAVKPSRPTKSSNRPEYLSRMFTIKGKIAGRLNRKLRAEKSRYAEISKTIFEDKKYMEGILISARCRK
jgi:ubiquinone/menaquinone biosynthesis C-methylase UbiE